MTPEQDLVSGPASLLLILKGESKKPRGNELISALSSKAFCSGCSPILHAVLAHKWLMVVRTSHMKEALDQQQEA